MAMCEQVMPKLLLGSRAVLYLPAGHLLQEASSDVAGPTWSPPNSGPHKLCPVFLKAPPHGPHQTGSGLVFLTTIHPASRPQTQSHSPLILASFLNAS